MHYNHEELLKLCRRKEGQVLRGLCRGERPEYRPFRDLRSVPQAGRPREQVENHGRAYTQVLFLREALPGFFHFLEIVTGWMVRSAGQKIPVDPGWYLPPQNIPLAENRFLQAGKGAENAKEKSKQSFTCRRVTHLRGQLLLTNSGQTSLNVANYLKE
jgi:hypothetical protein